MHKLKSLEERFHEKYKIDDDTGCWMWTRATMGTMFYGNFWDGNTNVGAHRFSWEIHNGPIPEGLCVCHHCDVPLCVNPDHLFLGTHKDNMQDASRKGRLAGCGQGGEGTSEGGFKKWQTQRYELSKYYGDFYRLNKGWEETLMDEYILTMPPEDVMSRQEGEGR